MSDPKVDDLRADWTEHPYSGMARKWAADAIGSAVSALHGACSQSTDPKVRGAYERLKATERFLDLLRNGVT